MTRGKKLAELERNYAEPQKNSGDHTRSFGAGISDDAGPNQSSTRKSLTAIYARESLTNNSHLGASGRPSPNAPQPGQTRATLRGPGNSRPLWSKESTALLIKMKGENRPREEIAEALGRSIQAIQKKLYSLGLTNPNYRSGGYYSRKLPLDNKETHESYRESSRAYAEAVIAAGGGSWSGVITPNAAGSSR